MIQKTNTWALLKRLSCISMSHLDLYESTKEKVLSTARYSLKQGPFQDRRDVLQRCQIAMMAEQLVADTVSGYLPTGEEDHDNPYSFAYDVIAKDGVRIEVKTHQSSSRWISVNTGVSGEYPAQSPGINLGPFLNHKLADLIIIFDAERDSIGTTLITPKLMAGRDAFHPSSGLVQKSQHNDGWYLRSCNSENFNFHKFMLLN